MFDPKGYVESAIEQLKQVPKPDNIQDYVPKQLPDYIPDDQYKQLAGIISCINAKPTPKACILSGPTGCGKSTAIKWLAARTGNAYRRIQLNGGTTSDILIGHLLVNEKGTFWNDGILTQAMRYGHWLVLDEVNMALQEILTCLNPLMDLDMALTLDENNGEVVTPHPNFRLFATMNPSDEYAGTKELNRAFLDRFRHKIEFDYPSAAMELKILEQQTLLRDVSVDNKRSIISRMVEIAQRTRVNKRNDEKQIMFEISTRGLVDWASSATDLGVFLSAEYTILNKADEDSAKAITTFIKSLFAAGE